MLKLDVVDLNSLSGRVDVGQSTEIPDAMAAKVVANFNNSAQDNTKYSEMHSLCSVIDCNKFSSLKKLIVTTGYMLRFIKNPRKRTTKQENLITDDMLTVAEFKEALQLWIKDEQHLMKKNKRTTVSVKSMSPVDIELLFVISYIINALHDNIH